MPPRQPGQRLATFISGDSMRRITLTQYLVEQQREKGIVSAELRLLIEVVARACKSISNAVSKGDDWSRCRR